MAPPRSGLWPPPPRGGAADGPAKPVPWRLLGWAPALLVAAAGCLQALSIAAPWDGQPRWWLQLLSLAVFAFVLQRELRVRRGFLVGWAFATAWLAGTFWWLYISMHTYGGLPAVLAALAVLGLAAFLGLYYAVASAMFVRWKAGRAARDAFLFAALWLAAELMRASWFTGFPWGAGGYAHIDGPLQVLAPWVGVYGIGFVAALLACLLASVRPRFALRSWRYAELSLVALVVAVGVLAAARGGPPAGTGQPLSVALLQGNIPQDEKFQPGTGVATALRWYAEQLRDAKASLVVAPETAIPMLPQQLPDGYFDAVAAHFIQGTQAAIVGIPLGSNEQGYTNSVIGLKPGARPYRYDKHHLVPFGEFIPPLFKWFTEMMDIPLGDFNRGAVRQPSFDWQGQRLAPNVCYEDLFGEDLAARFGDPAAAPTVFVNVSNIAWFGDSIAIDQHLQISRMRALEFERPMIRATNTGATVIIDAQGRVTHSLQRLTRGVLSGEVRGNDRITPFAAWASRAGLWPLWLLSLGLVVLLVRRRP
jgi:apolipoprotein N-acyltransferase